MGRGHPHPENAVVQKDVKHERTASQKALLFEKVKAEYDAKGRRSLDPSGIRRSSRVRRRDGSDRQGECLHLERAGRRVEGFRQVGA